MIRQINVYLSLKLIVLYLLSSLAVRKSLKRLLGKFLWVSVTVQLMEILKRQNRK